MRARFEPFTFDTETAELKLAAQPVPLAAQPAKVLALLVENGGRLVTREAIRAAVWTDRFIDFDQGINACIRDIRRALGDESEAPRFVETLPRKGYRFIAPVCSEPDAKAPSLPGRRVERRPAVMSLAVLALGAILPMLFVPSTTRQPEAQSMPTEALEHYQAGRMWMTRNVPEAHKQAVERLQKAATLVPQDADVWAALALAWLRYPDKPNRVVTLAESAAQSALSLEPRHPEALLALAHAAFHHRWDWERAAKLYREALRADPYSAGARQGYGSYLLVMGQTEAGLAELKRAHDLAPLDMVLQSDMSWFLTAIGRHREALEWCDRLLSVAPQDLTALGCAYRPRLALGDIRGAAAVARAVMEKHDASSHWLSRIDLARPQDAIEAYRAWRRTALLLSTEEVSSFDWARVEADEGRVEQAVAHLREAIAERDPLVPLVPLFPEFRAHAQHPSFQEVVRSIRGGELTQRSAKCRRPTTSPVPVTAGVAGWSADPALRTI